MIFFGKYFFSNCLDKLCGGKFLVYPMTAMPEWYSANEFSDGGAAIIYPSNETEIVYPTDHYMIDISSVHC